MRFKQGYVFPASAEIAATLLLVVLMPCFCLFLLATTVQTRDPAVAEKEAQVIMSEICRQAAQEGLLEEEEEQEEEGLLSRQIVDAFPAQFLVRSIKRQDTDGDFQKEWIVFYQFDLTYGRGPWAGAIYDFDRGNPPIIFPYQLVPPNRNYLSEGVIRSELRDIVTVNEALPLPELFVYGEVSSTEESGGTITTDLNIFRQVPNSFAWELPRDEPRRYQVIGSFRGDGGIFFDPNTKLVTVLNREGYDRSELAVQSVYALNGKWGTYMDLDDPQQLSAPISSEVTFAYGMPPDVLDTPYPEKLVVGFYSMLPHVTIRTIMYQRYSPKLYQGCSPKMYHACSAKVYQCDSESHRYPLSFPSHFLWDDGRDYVWQEKKPYGHPRLVAAHPKQCQRPECAA